MFRGREVFHPELGKRILDRIAEQMGDAAKVEAEPRLDGRNMVMVLAPDKRAKQSAASKATAGRAEDGTEAPGTPAAPTAPARLRWRRRRRWTRAGPGRRPGGAARGMTTCRR